MTPHPNCQTVTRFWVCEQCLEEFEQEPAAINHYKTQHERDVECCKGFLIDLRKRRKLRTHIKKYHIVALYRCKLCFQQMSTYDRCIKHACLVHDPEFDVDVQMGGAVASDTPDNVLPTIQSALRGNLQTFGEILTEEKYTNMEQVMVDYKDIVMNTIRKLLLQKPVIKLHLSAHVLFVLPGARPNDRDTDTRVPITSISYVIFRSDQQRLSNLTRQLFHNLAKNIDGFLNSGSGFACKYVLSLRLLAGAVSFVGHGVPDRRHWKKQFIIDQAEDVTAQIEVEVDDDEDDNSETESLSGFIVPNDVEESSNESDDGYDPNVILNTEEEYITATQLLQTSNEQRDEETEEFQLLKSKLSERERNNVINLPCTTFECFFVSLEFCLLIQTFGRMKIEQN